MPLLEAATIINALNNPKTSVSARFGALSSGGSINDPDDIT